MWARREAILDAAWTVASAHGFDGVQMRAVAAQAGIAASSLYRHFRSKSHLLVTVLAREFERLDTEFVWSTGELAPQARLGRLTTHLHTAWQANPHLTEAMVRAFVVADTEATSAIEHAVAVIEDMLARALGGPTPSAHDRDVASLIADVWLANLIAVIGGRIDADLARERIDRTTRQLVHGTHTTT
ncbi:MULTISPECIES: TetR family transcriptional regulator [Mycobacteriaceae]|uniref:TetR/AcrR family transcriptional regulator n=4 Tax=Mycolicibacterium TaxID=1866885 RepID=A0A4Z0HNT3_MYCPR|nr:Transcriptional regulator, TetR family [Mycobacterium sp. VKM Ac-1817D]AMD56676.1 TetR family transcriptional regulator [Mycolicibacterium fortuitum subsp. fortuitum DSM 46621 = ATCC 6841 = JCM 6387]AWG71515.1 TetR/AcrR family transcriptional regulator [Mycobacteroides abscessus]MBN7340620.1 TetR family transcriptional regulator [Mycobacteroides abscessus subsp. massiliense]MBP3087323.1 TetR family transcriptional regulator [Mycolicibacterium fortuitum]MBU9766972.1 TetR/AcrR family transcri